MCISFSELPDEEMPAEQIWLDDEALTEHFERVREKREAKYGGEAVPDVDLARNELTADFRK